MLHSPASAHVGSASGNFVKTLCHFHRAQSHSQEAYGQWERRRQRETDEALGTRACASSSAATAPPPPKSKSRCLGVHVVVRCLQTIARSPVRCLNSRRRSHTSSSRRFCLLLLRSALCRSSPFASQQIKRKSPVLRAFAFVGVCLCV